VRLSANDYKEARAEAAWNERVSKIWDKVRFVETGAPPVGTIMSEHPVPVRTAIELAGLQPSEVRVEVVMGRVGTDGGLEDTEVMVLPSTGQNGTVAIFEKEIVPERTGRLGYALRISPNHCDDPSTRPCISLLKWSGM
jgi:starch phosphorylase